MVMQDRRLSISAKAIYGYFCSFAGAGQQAFPRVTRIIKDLGISKNSYYKHFNMLRDCGYIKAEQEHKNGRLTHNIYTLITEIQCTKIWDTVQGTKKQDTVKQDTVICDTRNINSSENQHALKSNSPSCRTSPPSAGDVTDRTNELTEAIQAQIGYQDFAEAQPFDMPLLDELVAIIVDAIVTVGDLVWIDGEQKPRELVRQRLRELDYRHIELVISKFKDYPDRVRKKRQFLLTMLYNSRLELDAHYTNEVRSDME